MTQFLNVSQLNGVLTLEINRPSAKNALCRDLIVELTTKLHEADGDSETRVLVLRSAGDEAFCAGADLKELAAITGIHERQDFFRQIAELIAAMASCRKPVISAIQGYAFGGGCGLVAASDIAIASQQATFCLPEIKLGIAPMVIMAPLFRSVQRKHLSHLIFSGNKISATEAHNIGLISQLVEHNLLSDTVNDLANSIASYSSLALQKLKESLTIVEEMSYRSSLAVLADEIGLLSSTEDGQEGVRSFLEKRKPRWQNR